MRSDDDSLGDAATNAGQSKPKRPRDDVSLGDERTLGGGGEAAGLDTLIDDIEVVDLESRYKVEGTLGRGGMGEVLLATDTRLDRKVAIKRIVGEAAGNRLAVQRFLTEAKAIAALNHPHVVQIYDYGRAKDGPFLIMEYVDGGSLLERCRESPIPLQEAIDLACHLCDGLAKAHDLGIVHRDIKPANVLLTKDGIPKLTDFGLAKATTGDHGQTMTGAVLGTPDFMPPEQRRDAAEVDHRSDLWSLAATIYQMVTGRSPKIIRFKDVPESIQTVLEKALEDHKDDRYQTARELRDALKASLRAGAASVEELVHGQCPSCGVKNDSSRRFCRGCGESLEAECLACTKPMPLWEEICGSCGAKQTPLLNERRASLATTHSDAERHLADADFVSARRMVERAQAESHPLLRPLTTWTDDLLTRIAAAQQHLFARASDAISEARAHEASHDYLSALFTLEGIPESLYDEQLPGCSETIASMMRRIRKTQADVRDLDQLIRSRVASKQYDGLQTSIDALLLLTPERTDLQRIRSQLSVRESKARAAAKQAQKHAEELASRGDFEAAFDVLSAIPASSLPSQAAELLRNLDQKAKRIRHLKASIADRVKGKQLAGLLEPVREFLSLKPSDADIGRLEKQLVDRDIQIEINRQTIEKKAAALWQECRFPEAREAYLKLTSLIASKAESTTSGHPAERAAACDKLNSQRQAAFEELRTDPSPDGFFPRAAGDVYKHALDSYRLHDSTFAEQRLVTEGAHHKKRAAATAVRASAVRLHVYGKLMAVICLLLILTGGAYLLCASGLVELLFDPLIQVIALVVVAVIGLRIYRRSIYS